MKIRRENIPDIIKTLQEKYDNTKPGEIIYDLKLISGIKETFIIPEYWSLPMTENEYYWKLIFDWIKIPGMVLTGHPGGYSWNFNYPSQYISHYNSKTKYFVGLYDAEPDAVEIT